LQYGVWLILGKDVFLRGNKNKSMQVTIRKDTAKQEIEKMFLNQKPRKVFHSKSFLGKLKWGEDALLYQKKLRYEWA
jgi:hypothetical protein